GARAYTASSHGLRPRLHSFTATRLQSAMFNQLQLNRFSTSTPIITVAQHKDRKAGRHQDERQHQKYAAPILSVNPSKNVLYKIHRAMGSIARREIEERPFRFPVHSGSCCQTG